MSLTASYAFFHFLLKLQVGLTWVPCPMDKLAWGISFLELQELHLVAAFFVDIFFLRTIQAIRCKTLREHITE
jgi:hypothetical protein